MGEWVTIIAYLIGGMLFVYGLASLIMVLASPIYSPDVVWIDGLSGAEHAEKEAPYIAVALAVGAVLLAIGLSAFERMNDAFPGVYS